MSFIASSSPQRTVFLENGGVGARILAFDWTQTPLGPISAWPASLRFALSLIEHSAFPTAMAGEASHG